MLSTPLELVDAQFRFSTLPALSAPLITPSPPAGLEPTDRERPEREKQRCPEWAAHSRSTPSARKGKRLVPRTCQASLRQLQLRIFEDARAHLRHGVEQTARLQRLAVLRR